MVTAPWWCVIISSRNIRSKAFPRAAPSSSICCSVAMPGIAEWSCDSSRLSPPLFFSQPSIAPISGFWAADMRSASRSTDEEAARPGTRAVSTRACS